MTRKKSGRKLRPAASNQESPERYIEGIPRPGTDHPIVGLAPGGMAVADGERIVWYKLEKRADGGIVARPQWRRDGVAPVYGLLTAPGGRLIALSETDGGAQIDILDSAGAEFPLATQPGRVTAFAVAENRLVLAMQESDGATAMLREIDLGSGRLLTEQPLASPDVDIAASPSGARLAIIDRRLRNVELRAARGPEPCPPTTPAPRPPKEEATECGCRPHDGGTSERDRGGNARDEEAVERPAERERRPSADPCAPGDAAAPDDSGGAIVADGGRVEKRPKSPGRDAGGPLTRDCWADLFWIPDRLRWAGAHLVATQGNFVHRLAILRASDMQILGEWGFDRSGALVFAEPKSGAVVVFHAARGRFEWVDVMDERFLGPLDRIPDLIVAPEETTYVGQETLSLLPEHVRGIGEVKVLVLPVIEPGQAYNEPDLARLSAFMDSAFFGPANAYYRENSYNKTWLTFRMLGATHGATAGPLVLPKAINSYFWPPFFPGGIELVRMLPIGVSKISFAGGESLTLHAQPRTGGGQAKDFVLPFCAATLRAEHDAFPVKITLTGGETALIFVRERNGDTHTVPLSFPPTEIQITQADVGGGLDAVATYLQGVIAAAEAAAGIPGGQLFLRPEVRRVMRDGLEFGELHINLNFAPGRPAGALPIEITVISPSAGLLDLGFGDLVLGRFNLGPDTPRLADYLTRLVRQAEADQGVTFTNRMFAETVGVTLTGPRLETRILLASKPGGPNASVTIAGAVGTAALHEIATPLPGSESTVDNANAPRNMRGLINDTFTAALQRVGGADPLSVLKGFDIMIIGFVGSSAGAPPGAGWNSAAPNISPDLREARRPEIAIDQNDPTKQRQLKSQWILARLEGLPSVSTLCHELGHAYGLDDLYDQSDHRDDLEYLGGLSLMDAHGALPHHCGYHKWQAGWIEESRIVDVRKPDTSTPIAVEALLVPIEHWDPGMEAAVRAAYPGINLPIAQLMRVDLGGDMGMFDLIEARQRGMQFSQGLPATPGLLVTNAIVYWNDIRHAVDGRYRRECHRLTGLPDLNAVGDEVDLGAAPELPATGVRVRVLDIRNVPRAGAVVRVFHTRITREKANYVDLGFTRHDPEWKNPDLWLDWPVDNPGGTSIANHKRHPEGTPTNQGDAMRVPRGANAKEPHYIVARLRNYGTAPAEQVRLEYFVCRPPGAGDRGNYQLIGSTLLPEIGPGAVTTVPVQWDVGPEEKGHTCLMVQIADYEVPQDAAGIALGTTDVERENNYAKKNVDELVPAGGSPYEPVEFEYSVNNSGLAPETAYLLPEGLSEGMRLTVSPPRREIAPGETAVFRCRLELDHTVIDAGCRHDREFTLVTWRETPETAVHWGACLYKVRPRKKTATTLSGDWAFDNASLSGAVVPDPGGGQVRIRVNFNNAKAEWRTAPLQPGGVFKLALTPPAGAASLQTEALYEGSRLFAPSQSPAITVRPYVIH